MLQQGELDIPALNKTIVLIQIFQMSLPMSFWEWDFKTWSLQTTNYFQTSKSQPRMDWANYTKRGQKLDFCLMLRSWRRRLRPWLHLKKKISFKDVWHSLLITYANDFLHDGQSIILHNYYQSANPPFLHWNFDPFCLDVYDYCECEAHFRVAKDYWKHCRFWRVSHAHREQFAVA